MLWALFLSAGEQPVSVVAGENGIIYVHSVNGNDTAIGSMAMPVLTVGQAISLAQKSGIQRINISEGTYTETGTLISRNVSLYGGYSNADWAVRDSVTYKTILTNAVDVTLISKSASDTVKSLVFDGILFNGTVTMKGYASANFTVSNNLFAAGLLFKPSVNAGRDTFVVDTNAFIPAGYDLLNPSVIALSGVALDMKGFNYPVSDSFPYDLTVSGNAFLGNETGINLRSYPASSTANVSSNSFYNKDAIHADPFQMTISDNTAARGNVTFVSNTNTLKTLPLTMTGNTLQDGWVWVDRNVEILNSSTFSNNSITNNSLYSGTAYSALIVYGNFRPSQSNNTYTVSGTRSVAIPGVTATLGTVYAVYIAGTSAYAASAILSNSMIQITADGDAKKYGVYFNFYTSGNEFTHNTIKSISAGTGDHYGLYHISGGIKIKENIIRVSNGWITYGVWNNGTVNEFINNTIAMGTASSYIAGIRNTATFNGSMSNNTIDGGTGVAYSGMITTHMLNNIFKTSAGVCVSSDSNAANWNVQNNNFSNCANIWNWNGTLNTLAELEADVFNMLGTASGNTEIVPAFTSTATGDYSLTAAAACNLRQGGLDLSVSYTTDAAGAARTAATNCSPTNTGAAGWSMGAYERD